MGREEIVHTAAGASIEEGFYGGEPAGKPTVTGVTGGNTALENLLAALEGLGLLTDNTTSV